MNVSALSFGASSLGGIFRNVKEADCVRTVRTALDLGINFMDVSPYYGLTTAETILGRCLKGIARDRYYLATKCGRYGADAKDFDFSARRVTSSVNESLGRLGTDYVDIIQVHDVEFGDIEQIVDETIPALLRVKDCGKARFVGITGLPLCMFTQIVERLPNDTVNTILSYCHYALNDTSLLEIVPTLQCRGVGIINASPLSMGLLSLRGAPGWHPAPAEIKQRCRLAAEHCQRHGTDIVKLAMQFAVSEPSIATTLFGTANPKNLSQNVAWIAEPIDGELLTEVHEILQPIRNLTWPQGRPENNQQDNSASKASILSI